MISITSIISAVIVTGTYVFLSFFTTSSFRMQAKFMIYVGVLLGLIFPNIEKIDLWGVKLNFQLYATILCGIEIFELGIKCYVFNRKRKKRSIGKRILRIYDSL